MSMKPRTKAVVSSLVDVVQRSVAGGAGGVGVVPAVIIACVLAALLIGGLAVANLTRRGSDTVRIPFVDRGGSEGNDDSSRANDELDENEASEGNAEAETPAADEKEPDERDDERANEERDGEG